MDLPNDVQQVLIGSLLGDGCIYIPKDCCNAYFSEEHSLKQMDYLKWKAEILTPHFGGSLSFHNRKRGDKGIVFRTQTHSTLTELRELWYPNGKKAVPEQELQKLTELGLAVWYQDDGNYNPHHQANSCELYISGFKNQELMIQKWFKERWGLISYIHYKRGPFLRFTRGSSDKLLNLVAGRIHPSMIYKLGHLHSDNQKRLQTEKQKRDNYRHLPKQLERRRKYQRKYRQKNRDKCLESNAEGFSVNAFSKRVLHARQNVGAHPGRTPSYLLLPAFQSARGRSFFTGGVRHESSN